MTAVPEVIKADPDAETFIFLDYSWSKITRNINRERNICTMPLVYHQVPDYYFVSVTPMDKNGYFNLSRSNSATLEVIRAQGGKNKNLKVIVEVNPKLPQVCGDNYIHISDVDTIVEAISPHNPFSIPAVPGTQVTARSISVMEQPDFA